MPEIEESFYTLAPWLAAWFRPERREAMAFSDPAQEAAFDRLAAGWGTVPLPALLEACERAFGKATVLAAIDRVVAESIRPEWAALARKEGKNGIADLARLLLVPLQGAPGWTLALAEERGGLQLRCTACPHAALGKAQGISEYVAHLVCGGDPHLVEGFNPRMGFRRTRMLTAGDDHCDHFYFMKPA